MSGPRAPFPVCESQRLPGYKPGQESDLVILGKDGLPLAGFKKVKPLKHVSQQHPEDDTPRQRIVSFTRAKRSDRSLQLQLVEL